jgi:hypothetical protein
MKLKFDSAEWRESRNAQLLQWMQDDKEAVDFLVTLFSIGEVWDDLIDRDKPITDEQIHQGFIMAIFDLTANPFFAEHASFLRPVMLMGANAWMDSAIYEKQGDEHWYHWSFILRGWYMEMVAMCAFLTGGYDNMRAVGLEARSFFQGETIDEYIRDLRSAKA